MYYLQFWGIVLFMHRHDFHKSCIDPWLLEHRTCPMCKMDILKHYGFVVGVPHHSNILNTSATSASATATTTDGSPETAAPVVVVLNLVAHVSTDSSTDAQSFHSFNDPPSTHTHTTTHTTPNNNTTPTTSLLPGNNVPQNLGLGVAAGQLTENSSHTCSNSCNSSSSSGRMATHTSHSCDSNNITIAKDSSFLTEDPLVDCPSHGSPGVGETMIPTESRQVTDV